MTRNSTQYTLNSTLPGLLGPQRPWLPSTSVLAKRARTGALSD